MIPQVSVIIATHNRPHTLEQALQSVSSQADIEFECIVVDDAGDQPAQVPDDPRFTLVRLAENVGCAAARNIGIEMATADAVTFLDDDDELVPNRLLAGLRGLQRAPISLVWRFTLGEERRPPGRWLEGDCADSILDGYTPHLGELMVQRDVLLKLDPTWAALEDVEWWLRMASRHPLHTTGVHGYAVRQHDGVRVGNGTEARLTCSLRLLEQEAHYFSGHKRALAFRHERVAALARALGKRGLERQHLWRSVKARRDVGNMARLGRSVVSR